MSTRPEQTGNGRGPAQRGVARWPEDECLGNVMPLAHIIPLTLPSFFPPSLSLFHKCFDLIISGRGEG